MKISNLTIGKAYVLDNKPWYIIIPMLKNSGSYKSVVWIDFYNTGSSSAVFWACHKNYENTQTAELL